MCYFTVERALKMKPERWFEWMQFKIPLGNFIFPILNINITEDNIQSELPKNASKEYFAIMKIINNSTEKELSIYLNILKVLKENL